MGQGVLIRANFPACELKVLFFREASVFSGTSGKSGYKQNCSEKMVVSSQLAAYKLFGRRS